MYIEQKGEKNMSKKTHITILMLAVMGLAALLLSVNYFGSDTMKNAEPAHAEVIKTKGEVRKISPKGGRTAELVPGNALFKSDSVQTGADSAVTILFADQSKILVSENSRVSMVEMLQSQETGEVVTLIDVTAGSVESRVTTKKGFGAKYEVRTPSMQMAVRGTVFHVKVDEVTGKTSGSVLKGKVVATGSGKTVDLPAGYGTVAEVGKPVEEASLLLEGPALHDLPAVNQRVPLHLSWQTLPGAAGYRVQILAGSSGELLIHDRIYTDNSIDLADLPDAEYLVRVSGVNGAGIEGKQTSQPFSLAAHPVPPVASWPIDTESPSHEKVKFRWASSGAANSYIFQVSDTEDFATIISEVKNLPAKMKGISILLPPGKYFWRVASVAPASGPGPFSDHYAFAVVESAR